MVHDIDLPRHHMKSTLPNRFRDPELRKHFYRKTAPNDRIPRCHQLVPCDNGLVELSNAMDTFIGDTLCNLRDVAMLTRAMKLATTIQDEDAGRGKRWVNHVQGLMQTTWRDYVIPIFSKFEREAVRRGLVWNELTAVQEKKFSISFESAMAQAVATGLAANKVFIEFPQGRYMRSIEV